MPFLHTPAEDGADPQYAARSATRLYGSAKDLLAVINHYEALFSLGLSSQQTTDLIAFLKSL